jgi:hypothetical protein
MQPPVIDLLIDILMTQARECLLERAMLDDSSAQLYQYIEWSQEAALVGFQNRILRLLASRVLKERSVNV